MMQAQNNVFAALKALTELQEDVSIPKSVHARIKLAMLTLQNGEEVKIKVSKVLYAIEEMVDDSTIPTDTRTQLMQVLSLLEIRELQ